MVTPLLTPERGEDNGAEPESPEARDESGGNRREWLAERAFQPPWNPPPVTLGAAEGFASQGQAADVGAPSHLPLEATRWGAYRSQSWTEPDSPGSEGVEHAIAAQLSDLPVGSQWAVLEALREARSSLPTAELDVQRWGPAPDDDEYLAATAATTARAEQARVDLGRRSLSIDEAAHRLSIAPAEIEQLLVEGRLVALHDGDATVLPDWQFDDRSADGLLPGLHVVVADFPGGVVWLSGWMRQPNDALDGDKPRERLARGDVDSVVRAAQSLHG